MIILSTVFGPVFAVIVALVLTAAFLFAALLAASVVRLARLQKKLFDDEIRLSERSFITDGPLPGARASARRSRSAVTLAARPEASRHRSAA